MEVSCAFPTALRTPDDIALAEQLGYDRAWIYDTPQQSPDVWMTLALAAERTERIGLGPGVLVPSLRHPMVTASAIGTLVSIAGQQRVAIGIGSGFTGRYTMGQKPLKWSYVRAYVTALRALLRGEQVEWEGGVMQMMHPDGYAPPRPIEVPIVIAAAGPKGIAAAHEIADGVFGAPFPIDGFDWSVVLTFGTVLEDGEDPGSPRVLAAGGPGAPVIFHYAMEHGQLGLLPNGEQWAAAYADVPKKALHLALHDRHLIAINDRDRPFVTGALLAANGYALTRAGWKERLAMLESTGATEVAYQPAGPDIARELEAFAAAARG